MTRFEIPLGNVPRKGEEMHLVRWVQREEFWSPETVLVTYVSSTAEEWVVDQSGQKRTLPRAEWLQFAV